MSARGADDELRAERLEAWLERYSAGAGGSAASPASSSPPPEAS